MTQAMQDDLTSAIWPHVAQVMALVRHGLHDWARARLESAGVNMPVAGSVPQKGDTTLVLLPYQMVMESRSSSTHVALIPVGPDAPRDGIPSAWAEAGRAVTSIMVDHFPKRPVRGKTVGPLDPSPPLASIPAPVAAWYRTHAQGFVQTRADGEPFVLLPSVMWRQPFALAVRFAGLVVDPERKDAEIDVQRLAALGVLAAGVRIDRFISVKAPQTPMAGGLLALFEAFSQLDHPEAEVLRTLLPLLGASSDLPVGLTPHHELTDQDLAEVARALQIPMQASLVFSVRLSLGASVELEGSVTPSLKFAPPTPDAAGGAP